MLLCYTIGQNHQEMPHGKHAQLCVVVLEQNRDEMIYQSFILYTLVNQQPIKIVTKELSMPQFKSF